MSRNITIDDIIEELRSLTDEFNEDQLQGDRDILPELRRAQEKAYQVLSRVYPEPLLTYTDISGVSGFEYELPEEIYEEKVKRIEFLLPGANAIQWCERVSIPILSKYYTVQPTPAPTAHVLFSRKIRFNAPATGQYTLRIWHLRSLDTLVRRIGRITHINTSAGTLLVTDLNPDFDVASSDLAQYFNVVDGQTGLIKGSFQILSFDGASEFKIKTVPDRQSVLNRHIESTLATGSSEETSYAISEDDYICPIEGTCVLPFFDAVHTFIVQQATATLKRKLGYAYDADQQILKDFEAELNKIYMGRQRITRIKHGNSSWIQRTHRYFFRRI